LSGKAGWPLREAVLVMTMISHPDLLHRHLDDFASLEFGHPDLNALRGVVLSHAAGDDFDPAALRKFLAESRFSAVLQRLDGQIEACGYWPAMASASDRDAEDGWLQALTLQRRQR